MTYPTTHSGCELSQSASDWLLHRRSSWTSLEVTWTVTGTDCMSHYTSGNILWNQIKVIHSRTCSFIVFCSDKSNWIYTVSRKKGATDFFAVTFTNIDGFSIFFVQNFARECQSHWRKNFTRTLHSNDYATAQSLPRWRCAWSSSLDSLGRRSFNSFTSWIRER